MATVDIAFLSFTLKRLIKDELVAIIINRDVSSPTSSGFSEGTLSKLQSTLKIHLNPKHKVSDHERKLGHDVKDTASGQERLLKTIVSQLKDRIQEQKQFIQHLLRNNLDSKAKQKNKVRTETGKNL